MPKKGKPDKETMELGIGADYGWAGPDIFVVRVKVEGLSTEIEERLRTMAVMSILAKQVIPGDLKKLETGEWRVENLAGEGGEEEPLQ